MCGEHQLRAAGVPSDQGSSPHVRGTLISRRGGIDSVGIIPACAGNTLTASHTSTRCRDHPRMCGEHTKKIAQYQRYRKR